MISVASESIADGMGGVNVFLGKWTKTKNQPLYAARQLIDYQTID